MNQPATPSSKLIRADEQLLRLGLAASRTQAQALILAQQVYLEKDHPIDKPSRMLRRDSKPYVLQPYPYVSRGAEKLAAFLDHFSIDVKGLKSLDIGASTGGFTDLLLQRGVIDATCVDVGYGQLHYKLRQDPRVHSLERMNARYLRASSLPETAYGIGVMDVSFISLTKLLPSIWPFVKENGCLICLIKPQFEVDKQAADKARGVIRDPALHAAVKDSLLAFALKTLPGAELIGIIDSPILGAEGNKEFLMGLKKLDLLPDAANEETGPHQQKNAGFYTT